MRECQLCGAKSWGPVKDPIVTAQRTPAGMAQVPLMECDGCGVYAREDLIADPVLPDQETIDAASLVADSPLMSSCVRNFGSDFLLPFMDIARANGLSQQAQTVALPLVLDCAIAFGALEGQTTNDSLKLSAELEAVYWDKVARLKKLV
jgi:hypothetical protein